MLKYGWHGADTLAVCVEEEVRQEALKEYMADMLCLIARPHYESKISLFSELWTDKGAVSTMTADEIFDHVMNRLDELGNVKIDTKGA